MIITIDGPAGTGKTTVAKTLASKLNFAYFDTGAMYRAVTYKIMKEKKSLGDSDLWQILEGLDYQIKNLEGITRYFLDGEDVSETIRTSDVTAQVSAVSALPIVRKALVELQRRLGKEGNAVFEGRDMGTVVFPEAELKIFLTASPEVRAYRRFLENQKKFGLNENFEEVKQQLLDRDFKDSSREISPLKAASDAYLIDTSEWKIDAVVDHILSLVPKL